jgi:long-chain acyl-CoA synthetase
VQVRSESVFQGYYKEEEASRAAMTEDGWLKTGDAGFIDRHGHLVIIDRARDVGKLADGSAYAPQFVENKLKFSPYIGEVIAFGDARPFVAAIVAIDPTTVGNWAERHNLAYTSFQDLCTRAEIIDLVREEIRKCNAMLPEPTQIRRFLVINKEFDADDDEITRTRKIRRGFVAEKYAAVVEALYGGEHEVELSVEITYEDGRKAIMRSTLAIADTDEPAAPTQFAPPPGEPALSAAR